MIRSTGKETLMLKGECFKYHVQLNYFPYTAFIVQNHVIYLGSYLDSDVFTEIPLSFLRDPIFYFFLIDGNNNCLFSSYLRLSSFSIMLFINWAQFCTHCF